MRIGMFTDTWLPAIDGVIISIQKFKEGLEDRGHEVFIFAPEDRTGRLEPDDHTFLFKARTFGPYPDYRMALFPTTRMNRLIQENDIELLHNHALAFMGVKSMFASRKLELPILLHFHTWVTEATQYYPIRLNENLLIKLTWRYLRSLCRRSDGVVAPSRTAIEELRELVPDMRYTDFLSPGIDFERFNPGANGTEIRAKHDLKDSEVIIHVGRVSKEKNLGLVLDALPLIKKVKPKAKLMIVGDGPAMGDYKRMVAEKGLQTDVLFTGFVSDELLPGYYACADAFVMTSMFETLGIVMTEALATGIPVAGVNHRVVPEVVKHGYNGYLFEPDPQDCAEKLVMALDAPEEMRKNAVESVKRFNTHDSIVKLEEVYRAVMEVKSSRNGHRTRRARSQ